MEWSVYDYIFHKDNWHTHCPPHALFNSTHVDCFIKKTQWRFKFLSSDIRCNIALLTSLVTGILLTVALENIISITHDTFDKFNYHIDISLRLFYQDVLSRKRKKTFKKWKKTGDKIPPTVCCILKRSCNVKETNIENVMKVWMKHFRTNCCLMDTSVKKKHKYAIQKVNVYILNTSPMFGRRNDELAARL